VHKWGIRKRHLRELRRRVPPQRAEVPAAPAPAPEPPKLVAIPTGTVITLRITQALSSKNSKTGDTFTATVASPVSINGQVVGPASSAAQGTVVQAQAKGKVKGEGVLQVTLTQLTVKGRSYAIQTAVWGQTEKGKGKRTNCDHPGAAQLPAR
jgi:hypothetical protein